MSPGSTLRAAISEGRSFSASLSSTTTKTLSKVARNSSTAATSPWRNSPYRRRYSLRAPGRTLPPAPAPYSSRRQAPRQTLPLPWRLRAAMPSCLPAGNFPRFSRSAKFRSRSPSLPACCRPIEREIELLAVRNTGQSKPQRRRFVTLRKQIAEREEIPLRLRHLLAFDKQMLGMQPIPRERLARRALALRNFVFVMRKCQVDSAGVYIQCLAEIFHGHRGTLNVPAGAPTAERRLPEMFSGFGAFHSAKSRALSFS